jgi:hypothetical protein
VAAKLMSSVAVSLEKSEGGTAVERTLRKDV